MYFGIDIGTTGVKGVLIDDAQQIIASHHVSLSVSRPYPLWSEQSPQAMWEAVDGLALALQKKHPVQFKALRAIGLAGQMHGAILLDRAGEIIRPAILWNDGRAHEACEQLKTRYPAWETLTGNLLMPGFTAPKIAWVAEHEPENFLKIDKVLLPKDYIRYCLTNTFVSDCSDASGTGWFDIQHRKWHLDLIEATGLLESQLPTVVEGVEATCTVSPKLAQRWQIPQSTAVVGGAGDNAASAISMNVTQAGQSFLSLGTSGVYFVVSDTYRSNQKQAVHSFCHCLPDTWHQMNVHLNAASCLAWLGQLFKEASIETLLAEAQAKPKFDSDLIFLPYLSGERTPYNNPHAKGVLFGMTANTERHEITNAVLAGVAFAFVKGQEALEGGIDPNQPTWVVGGGAKSHYWCQLMASALNKPLALSQNREVGAALGAAKLAWLNQNGGDPATVFLPLEMEKHIEPCSNLVDNFSEKMCQFSNLYECLSCEFNIKKEV